MSLPGIRPTLIVFCLLSAPGAFKHAGKVGPEITEGRARREDGVFHITGTFSPAGARCKTVYIQEGSGDVIHYANLAGQNAGEFDLYIPGPAKGQEVSVNVCGARRSIIVP